MNKEQLAEKREDNRARKARRRLIKQVKKMQGQKHLNQHDEYICSQIAKGV